ncbi:MAG: 3-dehydroquinate synthase family protein [Candidatus Firestonebacteria bacterium]
MSIKFIVQSDKFTVPDNCFKEDTFQIKSIPRPYNVVWDDQAEPYKRINKILSENTNNLLFIDEKVYKLHGKKINISKDRILFAKAAEEFKTLNGVIKLIDFLQEHNFTKGEKLVVVGGGIIQDVGAFAGISFKRGIPWIYFPTTLLSMCDSCIGAKAGVNHKQIKNQISLFSSPSEVIINPSFLKTLPSKDLKSGLGEILKLYIIGGKKFINIYKKIVKKGNVKKISDYKKLLLGSLHVKKAVIELDEFENNHRKVLNYGHTLGHAIESMSNYKISHGQGVALGMLLVNEFSYKRGHLPLKSKQLMEKLIVDLLDEKVINIMKKLSVEQLANLLKKDKKTMGNTINFAILTDLGNIKLLPLNIDTSLCDEIRSIINKYF